MLRFPAILIALVLSIFCTPAMAVVIWQTNPAPAPPPLPHPLFTSTVSTAEGCIFDDGSKCYGGHGYWNGANQSFHLANAFVPTNRKLLRLHIVTGYNWTPKEPASDVTIALDPLGNPNATLTSAFYTNHSGQSNDIIMTWSIFPQPASEEVNLTSLHLDLSQVLSMNLSSECPEPTTWALLLAGFGMVGGFTRHMRRLQLT